MQLDDDMKEVLSDALLNGRDLFVPILAMCIRRDRVVADVSFEERRTAAGLRHLSAFKRFLTQRGLVLIKTEGAFDSDGGGDVLLETYAGSIGVVIFKHRPIRHKVQNLLGVAMRVMADSDISDGVARRFRRTFPVWVAPKAEAKNAPVYMLTQGADGAGVHLFAYQVGLDLERGNYDAETLSQFDMVARGLETGVSRGRLVLLDGPPGTGKTHLILGLMNACPSCTFVYVFPHVFGALSSPSLLPVMVDATQEYGRLVLVIEDADDIIAPRALDNSHLVSFLLNLCDGILGRALDIHVIATTNAARVEVDKALERKRRLHAHLHVAALSADVATTRLRQLIGDSAPAFAKSAPLSTIYDQAIEMGWQPPALAPGRSELVRRLSKVRKRRRRNIPIDAEFAPSNDFSEG
jgi:hypothetical protein